MLFVFTCKCIVIVVGIFCRPHPNECSGGDLDGDLFFISWDKSLIPPTTVPPMDYSARRPRNMDHDVTLEVIQVNCCLMVLK